jgi:hypothetical protein
MDVTRGTNALVTQLADEIIKRLDKSYDLVYVDYRDQLTDTQASALVRGNEGWLDESWEFESESKYESAKQLIDDLAREVIDEWGDEADADLTFVLDAFKDDVEEWSRVRFEVEDRDTGAWVEQLVRQTPSVLLRIGAIDEDHAYSFEQVTADRVLKDLGLPATRANVKTVGYVLANATPEYSVLMGYWIVGADLSSIYELAHDVKEVEIVNPYLYLGNPFAGSGFISEQPIEGVVRVRREDLRTDRNAFGYAVGEIYGGLCPSDFEAEIRPVRQPTEV